MSVLYVTSDRPGAGRTALASALALHLRAQGRTVSLAKPFSLGGDEGGDADVAFFNATVAPGGAAAQPALLSAGDATASLDAGVLRRAVAAVRNGQPEHTVVVEGLPLGTSEGQPVPGAAELATAADARVVLVVQYRPDLAPTTVAALARPLRERLAGVVLNGVTRHKGHQTRTALVPTLESMGLRVLGVVPEDRTLLGVTVAQVAHHLEATWLLNEEHADKLVEHFLIGGFILDSGQVYFGRTPNKAVLCRVDRPDLQMAALRSRTPTSCLILTQEQEPIGYDFPVQYVRHEALWLEVPVLLVRKSTVEAADALDCIASRAAFHHPLKLERYQALLQRHVDLAPLTSTS